MIDTTRNEDGSVFDIHLSKFDVDNIGRACWLVFDNPNTDDDMRHTFLELRMSLTQACVEAATQRLETSR